MADAMRRHSLGGNAVPSGALGATESAMVEFLFIYQLARNPMQAITRRWWCRSLHRASRGRRRCPECTLS
jgi:hypothetical protein